MSMSLSLQYNTNLFYLESTLTARRFTSSFQFFNSLIIIMISFIKAAVVSYTLAASVIATSGNAFHFNPGLGACGLTNTSNQFVASVSASVFNSYQGATVDPKDNPICQLPINVTYHGTTVYADIVDHFNTSGIDNYFGLAPIAFEQLAPTRESVISGVEWFIM